MAMLYLTQVSSYFAAISAMPWTVLFCNTTYCDADRGCLRTDDNCARSLDIRAVQRRAEDPSIMKMHDVRITCFWQHYVVREA